MRHVFDCDHIIVNPSIKILKKLNKLAFVVMGDMNWHNHVGIYTTAARTAIQQGIPLIFWAEHGYADLCGQFSMDDFPEVNYRERLEHEARGFEWNFFVGLDDISENEISKEFKTQIIKTPLGNISDPIFLPQGIVLFKVRDIKTSDKQSELHIPL